MQGKRIQTIKNLDAQIDGIVKTDKPFQFETDDITGTSLAVGKPFAVYCARIQAL